MSFKPLAVFHHHRLLKTIRAPSRPFISPHLIPHFASFIIPPPFPSPPEESQKTQTPHRLDSSMVAIDAEVGDLDVVLDLDEVGDVVVGLVATLPMTRTHSLPVELLIIRFLLKEMLGSLLKDVVMVDHEVLTVVVVVVMEVSAMVKLVKLKKDDLGEHLIVAVGLDEGSGRGNWGTQTDELAQVTDEVANETEKNLGDEKPAVEEDVADDNQELELDLSSLGAVNTMFAAFFSKLGVPIKTTVSATVLEEALNGLVTIRPLPLGHNISKRCVCLVKAAHVYVWMPPVHAYKAASRLTSTTPPPAHVLSRGIGWQGIGILLNSLFGTLTGSTVSV
ncbi:Chaperone protein dnaJ 16 [Glycine soja]